jgi:hypothetical protein
MYNVIKNPDGSIASVNGLDFNSQLTQQEFSSLSNSFPSVTGDIATFNSKRFISDLSYAVGKDNWNGFVKNDPLNIPDQNVPVSSFAGTGDPRYPMNVAMQDTYNEFFPRIQAYTDILNAGGCQIINNYVCDSDGVPILETSSSCSLSGTPETLRFQPQDIVDFVTTSMANKRQSEADSFIAYLQKNYISKGYSISLLDYAYMYMFVVRASLPNIPTVYLKYFYDQKDYISKQLNIAIVVKNFGDPIVENGENPLDFINILKTDSLIFNV